MFLISRLAEHTRNLSADARASLLLVDPFAPTEGAPRLTLIGRAELLTLSAANARAACAACGGGTVSATGRFCLLAPPPERLRVIGGFCRRRLGERRGVSGRASA